MTLFAHKAIDSLRGHPAALPLLSVEGSRGVGKVVFPNIARSIELAEKFEFTAIPLVRNEAAGLWNLPTITADEKEAWARGLLPLPAPVCWFEFVLGGCRSGVLCYTEGTQWTIKRFDLTRDAVSWSGVTAKIDQAKCSAARDWDIPCAVEFSDKKFMERLQRSESKMLQGFAGDAWLVIYMVLMLNSRTTEHRTEAAPAKLNKKRTAKGEAPLFEHRVVKIVPDRFIYDRSSGPGQERRSPRLHWRRSHKRHYPKKVPSAVWAEHEQWDGQEGWWVAIIPRFLVGAAENGVVSHEYRIDGPEEK